MKPARIAVLVIIAAAFAATALAYPSLPETVATHWGPSGTPDGFSAKTGVWLVPVLMAGLAVLLFWLPAIFPLRSNIEAFRPQYEWFIAALEAFLLVVHAWTLAWNLGYEVSPNIIMPLGMGLLFVFLGVVMGQAKRNWVFGVRTAWTLSDDRVWDQTHRVARWLWIGAGLVTMLGALWPPYAMWFIFVPVIVATVGSIGYSYVAWVRLGRPQDGGAAPAA